MNNRLILLAYYTISCSNAIYINTHIYTNIFLFLAVW